MADLTYPTAVEINPLPQRIVATLEAHLSWNDDSSNELVSVVGTTENVGVASALVNVNMLPSVGSEVKIRLMDEDKTIIETFAQVIRIERDPSKPQIALSISKKLKSWQESALTAAQDWVTRDIKLNYEGDDWLN